jgi:hypothetical protein
MEVLFETLEVPRELEGILEIDEKILGSVSTNRLMYMILIYFSHSLLLGFGDHGL